MVTKTRRAGAVVLAAAAVAALGAAPTQAANKSTKVTIALTSTAQAAPFYLGVQKGFYDRQGINLVINKNIATPVVFAAIASGSIDGAGVSYGALATGISTGIPLVGINTISLGGLKPETDDPQLLVRADSGINSVADLKDKKVAINAPGSTQEVTVRQAASRARIDPQSVKVLGVPFAQQGALIRNKQVDAVLIAEPFTTQLKQQVKMRVLAGGTLVWKKNQQFFSLSMSRKWWDANKAVGLKLQLATRQSVDYAARHIGEVKAILPTLTGVSPFVTQRQALPRYHSTMDVKDIQNTARIIKHYGLLKTLPDMSKFLIKPKPGPKKKPASKR